MDAHTELLARVQFAFTIGLHIVFPALTIGLSAFVATLLVLWRQTGADHYERLARFWTKVFAVSFAMGVVSGIPMSFQFGTNWSRFAAATGNVIGPLIGYEVLTAFFLEATFLAVMLFGWRKVPPWVHVSSAVLVSLGTAISGFWILAANSWLHTPAGFEMRSGVAYPTDWLQIIFNPSFPFRFAHMMSAAYLTTSVMVLATGARYQLAKRFPEEAKTLLHMGLGMVALMAPLQLMLGDLQGLNTLEHQPVKIAAMEGHWQNEGPADLVLFAWPDEKLESNRYAITVPHLGSLILTHDWNGRFAGLKDFPPAQRPPVPNVFFAFRIMVGIGVTLIALGLSGAWLWWRGRLLSARWYLRFAGYSWPLGFIAILAGWVTTEQGRQPYLVYGVLRTSEGLSPAITSAQLATSLAAIVVTYSVVFSVGVYYIRRLIGHGPQGAAIEPAVGADAFANRPLSAAQRSAQESRHSKPVF